MNPKFILFILVALVVSVSSAAFTVTINSPANYTNTSDSTPSVAFTITGDNTTYNYSVIVDGAIDHAAVTQRINNNTQHHVNLSVLTNGTHWFVIEGRNASATGDAIVSVNSTNITFKVDNVNPGVTITSPGNSTNTTDSTPEIRFNVSDNVHATNLTYRIYVDGTMQMANDTNNNTNVAYNLTALTNGTHRFAVEVTDPSGGVFNASLVTITIDNINPGVTITSPGNSTNTTDSTPEIRFNVSDNVHATNLTYRVYVDGSVVTANDTNNNTNIAYNFTALTNGTHNFRVEVNDPSGNGYNTTLFNITVDNVNPGVTITSPGNSTNTTDSTPEIRFNVTDNVAATNLTYRIYMDSTLQTANDTNNNTNVAYNFTALTNGTHRFTVEVTDPAGGVFNASLVTITVDNVNPVAATVSPPNETSTTDTTPQIYFNITDNVHATNLTYRIYVGGTVDTTGATINNTNVAYNLSTLAEGSYVIRIEATDPSGNAANSTALFLYVTVTTTTTTVASGGGSSYSDTSRQSWNVLSEGVTTITVGKSGIAIGSIELDVKNSVSNAKITVEKVSGVDATLAEKMTADVYQYIEITPEGIKSSDIKTAAITFTVTKAWLAQNNFGKEDVVLMRYTMVWDELSTKVKSETSSDVTFSAETPGFSTFAIAARAALSTTTTIVTTTTIPAGGTTTTLPTPPMYDITGTVVSVSIAALVLVILAWVFRHKFMTNAAINPAKKSGKK